VHFNAVKGYLLKINSMIWFWAIVGMVVLLVVGVPFWVSILITSIVWIISVIAQTSTKKGNASRVSHESNWLERDDKRDDSVIDISGESIRIPPSTDQDSEIFNCDYVPYWSKEYIYSTRSLEYASARVKAFYKRFKNSFISGEYLSLDENENYAFTLMFDFLDEYDNQPDLTRLTTQMQALIEHYPVTKPYAELKLIQRAKKSGQWKKVCTNGETSIEDIMEQFPHSREWSFSDRYSEKLRLSKSEQILFDYFESKWDSMCSGFEFMKIRQVELFREVMKDVKEQLIYNTAISFNFKSQNGAYDHSQSVFTYHDLTIEEKVRMVKNCIFRLCRNKLYERYELNRSVDIFTYEHNERSKKEITGLLELVGPLIDPLAKKLPEFTDEEETEVNTVYRTRWRIVHEEVKAAFNQNMDVQYYLQNIHRLTKINKENPGVQHLLFDAAKLLAGINNVAALKVYLQYIDVYHHFFNDEEKPLPKCTCKKLFRKEGLQSLFEDIVNQYKKDKDREKAYEAIHDLYLPVRRKINLDKKEIEKITRLHSETVQLLNEVMDEEEDEEEVVEKMPVVNNLQSAHHLLDGHQLELLGLFKQSDYCMTKTEVEDFAKSKGFMANGLIEKINDLCYETLDDVLIEDDEDCFVVSDDYLKTIIYGNQS